MGYPIITVSRQYGSAGRDVARKVAEELKIPYYDKEVISMTAAQTGFSEEVVRNEERKRSVLSNPLFSLTQMIDVQVFMTQSEIIQQLAVQPCVIVGRCADYALADYPNHLSLFISAPLEVRIQRVAQRQNLTPEKARQLILKTDKRRASYYEYYSSKKWGSVDSYHFCIDSSYLGLGRTVELIQAMVAHKEHPIPSPTEEDPTRPRT